MKRQNNFTTRTRGSPSCRSMRRGPIACGRWLSCLMVSFRPARHSLVLACHWLRRERPPAVEMVLILRSNLRQRRAPCMYGIYNATAGRQLRSYGRGGLVIVRTASCPSCPSDAQVSSIAYTPTLWWSSGVVRFPAFPAQVWLHGKFLPASSCGLDPAPSSLVSVDGPSRAPLPIDGDLGRANTFCVSATLIPQAA